MIIQDDIYVWAQIPKGLPPCKVWQCLEREVGKATMGTNLFEVQVGMGPAESAGTGKTISVQPSAVLSTLREDEPLAWLSVKKHAQPGRSLQSYTYFPKYGVFSMRLARGELTAELDYLVAPIFHEFSGTNALAALQTYLRSQRAHRNPGNNNLLLAPAEHNSRDGYIEGIAAEMWLGESFWQYAKCMKEDVLKADWLKVEDRGSHLHVVAWPEPFTSADGEQGAIQRRLLAVLFGIE
jgi:hypothetical protein